MSRAPIPPLPGNPLIGGQIRSLRQGMEQISELASQTGAGGTLVQRGPSGVTFSEFSENIRPANFLAVVVDRGPMGEADYTDCRYWIRSVVAGQSQSAAPDGLAGPYLDPNADAQWVTATNLLEAAASTHTLTPVSGIFSYGFNPDGTLLPASAVIVNAAMLNGVKFTKLDGDMANQLFAFTPLNATGLKQARITAVSGTFPTWTYTIQIVTGYNSSLTGAAQWVTDGVNRTALNRSEFGGTPTYTYGNGVPITSTSGQVNSTACVIKSIGVGAVPDVTLMVDQNGLAILDNNSRSQYSFSEMNSAY